jgi:5'-deoxynucleotidase
MKGQFFAYLSRMRYIWRWSLMRNALPENIQEHSHMVAVLAHALGLIRRDICHIPCNPEDAATAALFHDSSEILTGDLPTPIKYHSSEIRDAYKQVEALACDRLLDTLPAELRPAYQQLLTGKTQDSVHDLVKAADKLSAYIKCIEERKAGNNEFLSAEKQTLNALEQMQMAEVEYFLQHFIPAFELNLDELGTIV